MNNNSQYAVAPNHAWHTENKAKREKVEALRKEYIAVYTQRDAMLTNERDNIYCRYISLLGKAKYDNFKLWIEVRALKMKVELAQAALNRNQLPNIDEIESLTSAKLKRYFDELEAQSLAIRAAEEAERISRFTVKELKDLYRVLVRRLHPDLHPNLPDHLKDLFIKGQAAYRSYDIELLRDIIKRLDIDDIDTSVTDESIDDIIHRLTRDINEIKSDIENLRNSFPFDIERNLLDPVWINTQQSKLTEERTQLISQREIYTERLDLLTA